MKTKNTLQTRREFLRTAMIGAAATWTLPVFLEKTFFALDAMAANAVTQTATGKDGTILVVLELSGGNDGLNTLVPYADDAYYKFRPKIGLPKKSLRPIDDHFGFNRGMVGFERLYKDGKLAIVHGCGYENPSFSHFSSMAYWHTAAPNSGEQYGWVGRLADTIAPEAPANFIVNIDTHQSLAVRSRRHVPVVFDDPNKFSRESFFDEKEILGSVSADKAENPAR